MEAMKFHIELFFDTSCPYCFAGKKSLDTAIARYQAQHPEDEFNLVWRPFIFFPMSTSAGWSKKTPFLLMTGENAPAFFERMDALGAAHGIKFLWEGTTGNTRDSHKLILMAKEKDTLRPGHRPTPYVSESSEMLSAESLGRSHSLRNDTRRIDPMAVESIITRPAQSPPRGQQDSALATSPASSQTVSSSSHTQAQAQPQRRLLQDVMVSAIYHGAFETGRNVSDRAFLVETAISTGLATGETEALALMDSPVANALIAAGTMRATEMGITAIPSFLVQGQYRVGGYQRPEVFISLFDKMRGSD